MNEQGTYSEEELDLSGGLNQLSLCLPFHKGHPQHLCMRLINKEKVTEHTIILLLFIWTDKPYLPKFSSISQPFTKLGMIELYLHTRFLVPIPCFQWKQHVKSDFQSPFRWRAKPCSVNFFYYCTCLRSIGWIEQLSSVN